MSGSKSSLEGLPHDLTENALEFLQRAVGQMKASPATVRQLSFAVVDLAVAVEVLLKARLVREHWTLICDNPDKATAAAMLRGTLKTVSPDKAMLRLQHVAAVPLTSDHSGSPTLAHSATASCTSRQSTSKSQLSSPLSPGALTSCFGSWRPSFARRATNASKR